MCCLIGSGPFSFFLNAKLLKSWFSHGFAAILTFNEPTLVKFFLTHLLNSMLESYDSFDNWKAWDFILRSNSKRRMIPVSWAYCCSQAWCVKRLTFWTWLQISGSTRLVEYDTAVLYLVTQSCPSLCDLNRLQPTRLLCPQQFSRQEYWSGLPCPPPGDLPNPGIETRSPTLQADSLPSEPPGKTKNTGVGSLSLLKGIFHTQESNWGLLHCRWIFYQLSYQRSSMEYEVISQKGWTSLLIFLSMPKKFAIIQQNHKDRKE